MLRNLQAEYVRKGIEPYKGVIDALGCSPKTARNKLNELTPVTVSEAQKIIEHTFKGEHFTIEYLFATDEGRTA